MYALLLYLLHYRHSAWDAGTLDDLIGVEDKLFSMMALLEVDFPFAQFLGEMLRNLSVVRKEHIESFHLGENSGSDTAFSTS